MLYKKCVLVEEGCPKIQSRGMTRNTKSGVSCRCRLFLLTAWNVCSIKILTVRDESTEAFIALGSLKKLEELDMSILDPVPPSTAALAFKELRIQWCRGDPNVTNLLTEQMPSLEIHSSFEEEVPAYNTEGQESDAQVAEEEDEENAGPGNADESQDGSWENDEDSNGDRSSSNDSESNNIIWDESSIPVLFLEDI
ncbi:uncharacterized protein LOC126109516 [Schistocerca cancellata]|uniref:uncharacterized protein LOC126109516 n=1 Tax=Schistocerca cancellata TaxID=274614 RepID=UPI00211806BF|nr:uncharacterized protein LOC126109516 [Schistocerca cancellata]